MIDRNNRVKSPEITPEEFFALIVKRVGSVLELLIKGKRTMDDPCMEAFGEACQYVIDNRFVHFSEKNPLEYLLLSTDPEAIRWGWQSLYDFIGFPVWKIPPINLSQDELQDLLVEGTQSIIYIDLSITGAHGAKKLLNHKWINQAQNIHGSRIENIKNNGLHGWVTVPIHSVLQPDKFPLEKSVKQDNWEMITLSAYIMFGIWSIIVGCEIDDAKYGSLNQHKLIQLATIDTDTHSSVCQWVACWNERDFSVSTSMEPVAAMGLPARWVVPIL